MKIRFTKMHGCGNDYVYVDGSAETIENVDYTVYTLGDKKPVLILVY